MNHLLYKTMNDLEIFKSFELESIFTEICNLKGVTIITGFIYKHRKMNSNKFNSSLMSFLINYWKKTTKLIHGTNIYGTYLSFIYLMIRICMVQCVMCHHLLPLSCSCLCTPPHLCLCCYIILTSLQFCCVHKPKSSRLILSTTVHLRCIDFA